jgi:hypothetical protein
LALAGTQPKIVLPLGRTAYQTNESIYLAVVRSGDQALAEGELKLSLAGPDGSRLEFAFPVKAVPVQGNNAAATEHLHLNGWLLRPGKYAAEVAVDGATAKADFEVFSHERKTTFKLINWCRATKEQLLVEGEESLGFNLMYAHYGGHEQDMNIRAGTDYMPCCTMGGGHQMDLRMECDWSDPLVLAGGRARVTRRALAERTNPNCLGIHFYDEPGLTWWMDPVSNEMTNNSIPAQIRSFKSAYGLDLPHYKKLDVKNPEQTDLWRTWTRWKTGLMDAAWQDARFGVDYVSPAMMTATQSQYGWMAFSDGYYFQITRHLSVTSGHGGYHDWGPGYWHPSFTVEVARARDFSKPCWYLPTWYGNTTPEHFRLEQYLSFQTNIQGMTTPPDPEPAINAFGREGIVESNQVMGRLGTVFTTLPVTRPPVAMLYSLSHLIHANMQDPQKNAYAQGDPHGANLHMTYIAGKLIQQQFLFVVDEDILDGTLAAEHKAVVLTSIDYLDPEVVANLERFVAKGGLVLLTGDCKVQIKGAVNLGVTPAVPEADKAKAAEIKKQVEPLQKQIAALDAKIKPLQDELGKKETAEDRKKALQDQIKPIQDEKKPIADKLNAVNGQINALTTSMRSSLLAAKPLAKAIQAELAKKGIVPPMTSTEEGIAVTRQAGGDVEYLFAVNAAHDYAGDAQIGLKAATATLAIADDGRNVYDAVRSGVAPEFKDKKDGKLTGAFRFGPGEMRAFARTARPIAGVSITAPAVLRDFTRERDPLCVSFRASVVDGQNRVLTGSFPLRIRVIDPLGVTRYDLYRATSGGVCEVSLPQAANDAAGAWKIEVAELLAGSAGQASFAYAPAADCGALAGATWRSVHFGNDRANIARFFRVHRQATLIVGTNEWDKAAAERLVESFKPWHITLNIVTAAEMNKPEPAPEDKYLLDLLKKNTWCGPGGFDVPGPCILLGSPEDNPLIKAFADWKVLPYAPVKDVMPGRGRGMIAWQLDCVRQGLESIALVAHDAQGMAEAAGELYAAMACQDPITPLAFPKTATVEASSKAAPLQVAKQVWQAILPDRPVQMAVENGKLSVTTHDGSTLAIGADGAVQPVKTAEVVPFLTPLGPVALPESLKGKTPTTRLPKYVATGNNLTAVAYWGGTLQVFDGQGNLKTQQWLGMDVAGLVWSGDLLVAGLADGKVVGLKIE